MKLFALKKNLRDQIHVVLREQQAKVDPQAPLKVRDLFLEHFSDLAPDKIIAGTMPIKRELDPWPLLRALAQKGHPLCLPQHAAHGTPLIFRCYREGEALQKGGLGIPIPLDTQPACAPDIILTPLLAFDRAGRRLGYGGGYFDATLKQLRAKKPVWAVGLAYGVQEVEHVPVDDRDEALDVIVTEKEVIVPR